MPEFNDAKPPRTVVSADRDERVALYIEQATASLAAGAPLRLAATGDSWFDYPLDKGLLHHTDVIAKLRDKLPSGTVIGNIAQYGDTAANLMGETRRAQLRRMLAAGADAILFSGGGNDLAGDQFRLWLDQKHPGADPATAINDQALAGILAVVTAAYEDLIALRDEIDPAIPILLHGYDFAIPNGVPADLLIFKIAGPWLYPSLHSRGWMANRADPAGAAIVKPILQRFASTLTSLTDPARHIHLVPTQGTLGPTEWANELHPTSGGFDKIADSFVTVLKSLFGGRV